MKTPDALDDAIKEAIVAEYPEFNGDIHEHKESCEIAEMSRDNDIEDIKKLSEKWFKYGEYLTVEIDTELGTCTVIEKGK